MKIQSLLILFGVSQIVSAQNFTEATGTPFAGVQQSSIAFADVDGDNDQDVLITGLNLVVPGTPGDRTSKLYTNDGSGNFSEAVGASFDGVEEGSAAFADVDGDNDQDVLITGRSNSGFISKLYTNDGTGNFSEAIGAPFEGVNESSIAFADVDGDNDQDVLITGQNSSYAHISKLYTNNGAGTFTEMMNTPFEGVTLSSIAFSDVDGDGDQDVLITGSGSNNGNPISKLYTNDGLGNFTEVSGIPFVGVTYGAIAFADVDGDTDQDVLITGDQVLGGPSGLTSKLYTNDGTGNFTEVIATPFTGVMASAVAFADVDGDNDQDVLITGGFGGFVLPFTGLYANDGSGNFTQTEGTIFDDLRDGSIAFADVDGDNDQDVLLTGVDLSVNYTAKLYLNDGADSSANDLLVNATLDPKPFPNPAMSNHLQVRLQSAKQHAAVVRVYDLNGQLISQQHEIVGTGDQTLEVDIAVLPPGSYFLQLDDGKKSGVAKFMVQ